MEVSILMEKTKIKLIKEVYQYDGVLYEDLDTCLSDVTMEKLVSLCINKRIDCLSDFLLCLAKEKDFQEDIASIIGMDNYEVTE